MLGPAHVLAVAALMAGTSGCALLDLLLGGSAFNPDEPFPFPSAEATFTTGTAKIELEGETIVLDQLKSGGTVTDQLGTSATWTNGEGWYLTFSGYPDVGFGAESGFLSLNRIVDGQHWVTYDPTRCVTTTDHANQTGIQGTAICRGLEWSDYFATLSGLGTPQEIEGEPAFDADITFEAH